jgi:uncharacterized membrane protein HdeD (DUF308 family)
MAEAVSGGLTKKISGWSIVLGILMIIAGVIAMLEPELSGLVITLVVGWCAIFNGFLQIIYGFHTHRGWHTSLEVILGIIYIIAGIYLLRHPWSGLLALALFLASFLLVYGVFALVLAFRMHPRQGWGWVLFDAIVTILLGVLILVHWPGSSLLVVGTLFGISIFISGITRLMVSLALRKAITAAA